MGGDFFGLVADLARRHHGCRTGDGSAAAGVGAQAIGSSVGVAFLDGHIGGGDAQFFGDDLGVGGFVSLALAFGSHTAHRLAGGMDANLGAVEHLDAGDIEGVRRSGTDDFDETGDTDAHQLTACAFLLLLFASAS